MALPLGADEGEPNRRVGPATKLLPTVGKRDANREMNDMVFFFLTGFIFIARITDVLVTKHVSK